MLTTPIADLPYPELTDLPNGPSAFAGLATALDDQIVPRFANASARNLAITSPIAGQLVYLTSEGRYERYDGSGWRAIPNFQAGTASVTFAVAAATNLTSVTFPVAFPSTPLVFTNLAVAPAAAVKWTTRAINASTTGFQIYSLSGDGTTTTWSGVNVQWLALVV